MSTFIANYEVGIMPLKNLTFNTLDETGIAVATCLADVIDNFFSDISLVNLFIAPASSSIKNHSFGILILANFVYTSTKSFINSYITPIGFFAIAPIGFSIVAPINTSIITPIGLFVKADTFGNFLLIFCFLLNLLWS